MSGVSWSVAFRKILVAVDGSAPAWTALGIAGELALADGASLVILHVAERPDFPEALQLLADAEHIPLEEEGARYLADMRLGDALVREAVARVQRPGLASVQGLVVEGKPAAKILEVAEREGVDAIVLGSRGLGDIRSTLLGSVSHKVAHLANVHCILVK